LSFESYKGDIGVKTGLENALNGKNIDVYFDNVGGQTLEAALELLALHGRIVVCGAISTYNDGSLSGKASIGPRNYLNLIKQRGRMEGFLIMDYASRYGEAGEKLGKWIKNGTVKTREDKSEYGLDRAPYALRGLFLGANQGKVVVEVAPRI
jgi:NADPH-dependent curcumin reductase